MYGLKYSYVILLIIWFQVIISIIHVVSSNELLLFVND